MELKEIKGARVSRRFSVKITDIKPINKQNM
jgi:hypothetical protein